AMANPSRLTARPLMSRVLDIEARKLDHEIHRGASVVTRMTPAARRYLLRVAVAMAIYLASLFAAEYLIGNVGVTGPLAFALALIPGLAVAGLFYAIGMFIVETRDE